MPLRGNSRLRFGFSSMPVCPGSGTTPWGYAAFLERLPLARNLALRVGHGAVRIAVMGFDDRAPTPAELEAMQDHVARACEGGVFALSSGADL